MPVLPPEIVEVQSKEALAVVENHRALQEHYADVRKGLAEGKEGARFIAGLMALAKSGRAVSVPMSWGVRNDDIVAVAIKDRIEHPERVVREEDFLESLERHGIIKKKEEE